MSEPRFLRKQKPSLFLDEDQPLLRLLRDMFIEAEAEYNVKELAGALGVKVDTVYKMFSAQIRLSADALLAIMEFVAAHDPTDTRILDFICEPVGFMPMPKAAKMNLKAVREIITLADKLTKSEA